MPIIDVSQKTYRTLLKAAHGSGMSVDRFIQQQFGSDAPAPPQDAEPTTSTPVVELPSVDLPSRQAHAGPDGRTDDPGRSISNGADSAFDNLWRRIEELEGSQFATKRGQPFTYQIESGYLTVTESGVRIPKSQFKKALDQWPQNGPSAMRGIYAATIVWAVLASDQIVEKAA